MIIRAIDPGPIESAYVDFDGDKIHEFGKFKNENHTDELHHDIDRVYIEMISSYGMPVGAEVFETVLWIGRFIQQYTDFNIPILKVYRKDIKLHLCGSNRAKDANIIAAIVDRFDPMREFGQYGKGTKKNPGMFYGFARDHWAAFAVAVYAMDCIVLKPNALTLEANR